MPDCFISYSSKDQSLANFVHSELSRHGLSIFMASVSLKPGENWSDAIRANLKASSWVILLASRDACKSAYVLQETGMAMITDKKLIPIVWDISPSELPGWIDRNHALNLRGATIEQIQARISQIAQMIHQDRNKGLLIAGALIFGLLWLDSR
jgi:hypothetical protein